MERPGELGAEGMMVSEFAFPTTGDPEEDARIATDIRRQFALESEGLCPNGCAPLIQIDTQTRECPVCHCHLWSNTPREGL